MNNTLIFATHNLHKVKEVNDMLSNFTVLSLDDIGFTKEIPETGSSFQENSLIKANAVRAYNARPIFADDSGLVIPALNGEPGIYSARYANTGNSLDNIQKVLKKLGTSNNRDAYFITIISLILNDIHYFFEGKVQGTIVKDTHGINGFGYDPIFKPNGYDKTFAAFSINEKNRISHRALAIAKLKDFLENK